MSTAQPRLTPGLLAALGLLAAVSAVATDLYIPSIPSIASELHASASSVQLTLSLFFFGVGLGQLLLGPLSDSLGRRPVLLVGFAVFALTGIATVFVQDIGTLIALRLLQGVSGAVGIVLSRAIAADLSTGDTAVRALSLIAMVVGLGPMIAPVLGGFAHRLWDWRGVLAVLAVISTLMLLLAWRRVPESLPVEQRRPHGVGAALRPFGELIRDRGFVALTLAFALSFTAMISYISASPFIGQRILRMTPIEYALSFAAGASALLIANLVNARLAPRVGPARMLAVGSGLLVLGGLGMLTLVLSDALTIPGFIACAFALTGGTGLTMSNASALALARAGSARGSGSALIGTAQFALGGAAAPLVGLWGETTALPMAIIVAAAAALSAACATIRRRG